MELEPILTSMSEVIKDLSGLVQVLKDRQGERIICEVRIHYSSYMNSNDNIWKALDKHYGNVVSEIYVSHIGRTLPGEMSVHTVTFIYEPGDTTHVYVTSVGLAQALIKYMDSSGIPFTPVYVTSPSYSSLPGKSTDLIESASNVCEDLSWLVDNLSNYVGQVKKRCVTSTFEVKITEEEEEDNMLTVKDLEDLIQDFIHVQQVEIKRLE